MRTRHTRKMVTYLDSHAVSSHYAFWQYEEQRVRAFLRTTNLGMDPWLTQQWEAAETKANEIFNPDYDNAGLPAEIFDDTVGVWPVDYFWQLSSAVIKDACALYEVFLEQQANEVLASSRARLTKMSSEDSWHWNDCEAFYTHYVGVDVTPPGIQAVLWVRNKMTHMRDQLRTDAGRAAFIAHLTTLGITGPATPDEIALGLVEHPPYMPHGVHLSQLQTWRILNVLADQVGVVAIAAFPYVKGGATNPHLAALAQRTPLPIKNFRAGKLFTYL
jgi:hypothetical protein